VRIRRDQFLAIVKSVWSRDRDRVKALARQVVASNPKDAGLAADVDRIFGRDPGLTLSIPGDLVGIVREQDAGVSVDELVVARPIREALERVVTEHAYAGQLAARGLAPVTRLLFHGPSGTGKTSAASALAGLLDLPFFVVPMDALVGSYLGESSGRLRKALEFVSQEAAVVLLDEIDAIGCARGKHNDMGEQSRIVTTLLVVLDDIRRRGSKTVIVAGTNRRDALDPAIVRRFDVELEFGLPSEDDALLVAAHVFERAGVDPTIGWIKANMPRMRHSHAEVERWASIEAKRLVMQEIAAE